jgi:hypothetical protein
MLVVTPLLVVRLFPVVVVFVAFVTVAVVARRVAVGNRRAAVGRLELRVAATKHERRQHEGERARKAGSTG